MGAELAGPRPERLRPETAPRVSGKRLVPFLSVRDDALQSAPPERRTFALSERTTRIRASTHGIGPTARGEQGSRIRRALATTAAGVAPRVREYGPSQEDTGRPVERHEILQHAFLKLLGMVSGKRGSGYSRFNTVVELDEATHRRVSELQRAAKLHDRSVLSAMSAVEVIDANLQILRQAGLSSELIDEIWEDVSELLPSLGESAFNAGA